MVSACSAVFAARGCSRTSLARRRAATSRTSPWCRTIGTPPARSVSWAVGRTASTLSAASAASTPTRACTAREGRRMPWPRPRSMHATSTGSRTYCTTGIRIARRTRPDARQTACTWDVGSAAKATMRTCLVLLQPPSSAPSRTSLRRPTIGTSRAPWASLAATPTASTCSAAFVSSAPSRTSLAPRRWRRPRTGASSQAMSPTRRTFGTTYAGWACSGVGPTASMSSAASAATAPTTMSPARRCFSQAPRSPRTLQSRSLRPLGSGALSSG
mmetsp:Transcript_124727/g.399595  ORF Transcript_124727/g.399595 Transcript_124727/m.399595 type:complete len:272 (-) Transcript_124727:604-1419(-)